MANKRRWVRALGLGLGALVLLVAAALATGLFLAERRMARQVGLLLKDALDSFIHRDVELAAKADGARVGVDRVEADRLAGGDARPAGAGTGGRHRRLLQRPRHVLHAIMVHAGMGFVGKRHIVPFFGRERAPGLGDG